ncbi:MAG TPA: DUF2007 domain-containing protein [Candidatus Paceibacterota bacterium]|nr:DUF2007 domain-containing protein [Verrucomicrobiota bacterium]HRY46790.1 DUF2007 domain-containing protein [Candidatus Paceibacterota bacterium]HSA01896.1 DUF2007 domain-containing protein [Candidatus Paceibacterota bacterium]
MKLLHSSREPGKLERLRSALENRGIACAMRNELTSGLTGEIPITDSIPELWLVNDQQLPEALGILEALKQPAEPIGSPWTCSGCGESIEAQFDSCWRCGSHKPG